MASSSLAERFDLGAWHYAHRGLWSPDGPVENSLSAFTAAHEAGFGIEFDVRPAADGVPVVFHDPLLDRLTDQTGAVAARGAEDLTSIPLSGTADTLPTLTQLLTLWPGQSPLLCELKIDGTTDPGIFAPEVGDILLSLSGPVAAMSFNPAAVRALPEGLMRGQLLAPVALTGDAEFGGLISEDRLSEVDYLACHVSDAERLTHRLGPNRPPLVAWTVTRKSDAEKLSHQVDAIIFESFLP